MNEFLCKVISALNSTEVRECIESLGYIYTIAPLKYYNNIKRDKYTLDYNIKIFNASSGQIKDLSLAIIKKVFNDDYIKLLIKNNICMLSYVYNDISNLNNNGIVTIRTILNKYLGKSKYSYMIQNSVLKLVLDVPSNKDVSLWKPTIKQKEPLIIAHLIESGININEIEVIFSFNNKELDELSNIFLEIGYYIE